MLAASRAAAQDGDFELARDDAALGEGDLLVDRLVDRAGARDAPRRFAVRIDPTGAAAAYPSGPALSAVVAAALRAAGLASDPVPGWRRRSRWSALVPTISSRVGNSESWREVTDPTVSHAAAYDIRVSWRLERLIYDPNEPRFAAFDLGRRRERRRIITLASRLYIAWLHAVHMHGDDPALEAERAAEPTGALPPTLMQVELAAAELDALTDGWFSQTLAKPARSR